MKDLQLPVVITEAALLVSALNVSSFDSCRLISTLAKPPSIAVRASAEATARSDHMFLLVIGLSDSTKVNLSGATGIFDIQGINAGSETIGALQGVAGSQVQLGAKNLTLTARVR